MVHSMFVDMLNVEYYLVPSGWKMTASTTRNWLWKFVIHLFLFLAEKCKWRKKVPKCLVRIKRMTFQRMGNFFFDYLLWANVEVFIWRNQNKKKPDQHLFWSILMGTRNKQSFRLMNKFSQTTRYEWRETASSDWFFVNGFVTILLISLLAHQYHFLQSKIVPR